MRFFVYVRPVSCLIPVLLVPAALMGCSSPQVFLLSARTGAAFSSYFRCATCHPVAGYKHVGVATVDILGFLCFVQLI
jgi:hypothetical protein